MLYDFFINEKIAENVHRELVNLVISKEETLYIRLMNT